MKTTNAAAFLYLRASANGSICRTIALLAAAMLLARPAEAQNLLWERSYSGISASALEEVEGVIVDNAGNVFATGLSGTKTMGSVIRTMKLDANGNILWNVTHTQPSLCGGMWGRTPIAAASDGNLIVAGAEFTSGMGNWNPLLLKLNSASGAVLNKFIYDFGPFASFDAVAADSSGLYILAHNNPNNGYSHVVHILKLGSDGKIIWSDSYTPAIFWGTRGGIVVTASGVYSAAGGKVMAHDSVGNILWQQDMILPGGGSALAADGVGNIYLAAQNGIAKLDPAGNPLGIIGGISGPVSALELDAAGNIYLAGSTVASNSRGSDILTQKFNPAGNLVWSAVNGKNGSYSDDGLAITVRGGFVYVGGSKYNKTLDMCTLKYTAGN